MSHAESEQPTDLRDDRPEVWEGEVRNRLKTEADINDSELQHGEPHIVEVRYEFGFCGQAIHHVEEEH